MTPHPVQRRPAPVLRLGEDRVEWLGPPAPNGGRGYGRAVPTGLDPAALTEAVLAARAQADAGTPGPAGRRACVLALGGGLVRQRWLELPRLVARERHGVCLRKAANLLGAPMDDTLFCASGGVPGDDGRSRWLLACLRRSFLSELLRELASRGVRVARVVCARQAALGLVDVGDGRDTSDQSGRGAEHASIAIDAEPDELVVSLVAGGRLLAQNVVPGHFDQGALNARMLLAEVRSQLAFRRVTSRGDSVERVLLFGSSHERLTPLAQVLRAIAPTAEVVLVGAAAFQDERAARMAMLDACRNSGPFELDLTPRFAPRGRHVAALTALTAALALTLASFAHARVTDELAQLERSTADFAAATQRGAGAVEEGARARDAFERVARGLDAFQAVERAGWSLDDLLADALTALDDRAALRSLTVGAAGRAAEVVLSAWTDGDLFEAAQHVARVTEALEASVAFRDCSSEPELGSATPARPTDEPFAFRVRAACDAVALGEGRER